LLSAVRYLFLNLPSQLQRRGKEEYILEFWILGLLAVLLIAVALGYALVRLRRDTAARLHALSQESSAVRSELAKTSSELHFLSDFSQQFNGQMNFNETINMGLEALWHLSDIDSVAAVLSENEIGPIQYVGMRGVDDPFPYLGKESPLPLWGTLAHSLVHRPALGELDCLTIERIGNEGQTLQEEFPWLPSQGSLMVVPLRGSGATIGAIILCNREADAFRDENRKRFLYVLVSYLARALLETRVHEESARLVRHLVSLQALTRTMAGVDNVDDLLRVLSEESADMFGTIAVHLFLQPARRRDGAGPTFRLFSGPQTNIQEDRFIHYPEIQALLSWVIEAEQPLFVDPRENIQSPAALYYKESGHGVLVPILGSREIAGGVLLLLAPATDTTRPFSEDDLVVVRTLANSASVAISSLKPLSMLFEEGNQNDKESASFIPHASLPVN